MSVDLDQLLIHKDGTEYQSSLSCSAWKETDSPAQTVSPVWTETVSLALTETVSPFRKYSMSSLGAIQMNISKVNYEYSFRIFRNGMNIQMNIQYIKK